MYELETLKEKLKLQSPAKRLRLLRKKILKKNQTQFCQDGIIRNGTLKSIEAGQTKISPRIAKLLVHKMRLEGIVCTEALFLNNEDLCEIFFDDSKEKLIDNSTSNLEEIRQKLSRLMPITLNKELRPSLIPNGASALAREVKEADLINLNRTLCLVHGAKIAVSFLTYLNEGIRSEFEDEITYYPKDIIKVCGIYAIEILHFN